MDYVNYQLSSCILLLLTGMVLGGFLDLYRVFRGTVRPNRFLTVFGDLVFWILAFVVITPLIYWSTWLELRFYVWLSLLMGVLFYYCLFSRVMIRIFLKFWRSITWFPRQIKNIFCFFKLILQKAPWNWQIRKRG